MILWLQYIHSDLFANLTNHFFDIFVTILTDFDSISIEYFI